MSVSGHYPRPVLLYLAGFFTTNVGVGGFTLATGLALYRETGTAATFGYLVAAEYALGLVGQLIGGSLLDRRSVLNVALATNAIRGVAVLAGGAAFWVGGAHLPLVLIFLVSALVRPVYRSASFVLVRHVCPPEQLARINALRFGLLQAAQLTGLAVVAALFAVLSPGPVICVVACVLLIGTAVLVPLRGATRGAPSPQADRADAPVSFTQNWRDLGRVLRQVPGLRIHLLLGGAPSVLAALITVLVAPMNAAIGGGSAGIAVLDGSASVGALVAILVVRRLPRVRPAMVGVGCAIAVLGLLLLAAGSHLAFAAVAFLLIGTAAALTATALDTLLQVRAAPSILGRLSITQECAVSLSAICLIPLTGPLVGELGIGPAVLIYAAIATGYLLLYLVSTLMLRDRLFGEQVDPARPASSMAA